MVASYCEGAGRCDTPRSHAANVGSDRRDCFADVEGQGLAQCFAEMDMDGDGEISCAGNKTNTRPHQRACARARTHTHIRAHAHVSGDGRARKTNPESQDSKTNNNQQTNKRTGSVTGTLRATTGGWHTAAGVGGFDTRPWPCAEPRGLVSYSDGMGTSTGRADEGVGPTPRRIGSPPLLFLRQVGGVPVIREHTCADKACGAWGKPKHELSLSA